MAGKATQKSETKSETKAEVKAAPKAAPVVVDNRTARSDDDAQVGQWVDVVSGDHAGRRGSYVQTLSSDPTDGYPESILVRTRDAENELLTVDYSDARPTTYTGGPLMLRINVGAGSVAAPNMVPVAVSPGETVTVLNTDEDVSVNYFSDVNGEATELEPGDSLDLEATAWLQVPGGVGSVQISGGLYGA